MIKNIILYGGSNFSDEIVELIRDINKANNEWNIIGFLDDDLDSKGKVKNGITIIGGKEWFDSNDYEDSYFVCCIGNPKVKKNIVNYLNSKKVKFATLVHPNALISATSEVGIGTLICAGNIITTNVKIGEHVIVNLACTIGHCSQIGNFSTINPGANISGDVVIEEGVLIGTNATILEKKKIGNFSIIGAQTLVNKDVPGNVTAVGVPAKVIKSH